MIDKVLGKFRSWLHTEPSVSVATSSSGGTGALAGPALPQKSSGRSQKNVRVREASRTGTEVAAGVAPTSPVAPATPVEAFSRTMDAQPESGIVIGESGIIIIDEPSSGREARPVAGGGGSSDAWALPNFKELPPPPHAQPSSPQSSAGQASRGSSGGSGGGSGGMSDDWDQVLARARAQLTPSSPSDPHKRK